MTPTKRDKAITALSELRAQFHEAAEKLEAAGLTDEAGELRRLFGALNLFCSERRLLLQDRGEQGGRA